MRTLTAIERHEPELTIREHEPHDRAAEPACNCPDFCLLDHDN